MLRVVVDTSSLVSYLLTQGKLMRRVVENWHAGRFTFLSSPATREELASVVARPAIRRLAAIPLTEFVQGLERFTENVPTYRDLPGACRDPKDIKFLVCAVQGHAHYLVSSDRDLLELRRYQGIGIVNPGEFLIALELYDMKGAEMAAHYAHSTLESIQANIPLEAGTATRLAEALAMTG
ncbi:MAG: putative toxin-antitoxin system toxin component, PIN family [Anaerolineae bacterium]